MPNFGFMIKFLAVEVQICGLLQIHLLINNAKTIFFILLPLFLLLPLHHRCITLKALIPYLFSLSWDHHLFLDVDEVLHGFHFQIIVNLKLKLFGEIVVRILCYFLTSFFPEHIFARSKVSNLASRGQLLTVDSDVCVDAFESLAENTLVPTTQLISFNF